MLISTVMETGVKPLDEDHTKLQGLLGSLNEILYDKNYSPGKMESAFAGLLAHIEKHFQRENAWMMETGYPGAKHHMEQHERILEGLNNLRDRLHAQPTIDTGIDAYGFVTEFLVDHAVRVDKVIGGYQEYSKRHSSIYH